MSVPQPTDAIDIDAVLLEIDDINVQVLALLERGRALTEDAAAVLTQGVFDAGMLVTRQSATPDVTHRDGGLVSVGRAAGYAPITVEQKAQLDARLALVATMVRLLDVPLTKDSASFAQQIRAGGRRWRMRA